MFTSNGRNKARKNHDQKAMQIDMLYY